MDFGWPSALISKLSADCKCCPHCQSQIPCDGLLSGGLCDGICNCNDFDDEGDCYEDDEP